MWKHVKMSVSISALILLSWFARHHRCKSQRFCLLLNNNAEANCPIISGWTSHHFWPLHCGKVSKFINQYSITFCGNWCRVKVWQLLLSTLLRFRDTAQPLFKSLHILISIVLMPQVWLSNKQSILHFRIRLHTYSRDLDQLKRNLMTPIYPILKTWYFKVGWMILEATDNALSLLISLTSYQLVCLWGCQNPSNSTLAT